MTQPSLFMCPIHHTKCFFMLHFKAWNNLRNGLSKLQKIAIWAKSAACKHWVRPTCFSSSSVDHPSTQWSGMDWGQNPGGQLELPKLLVVPMPTPRISESRWNRAPCPSPDSIWAALGEPPIVALYSTVLTWMPNHASFQNLQTHIRNPLSCTILPRWLSHIKNVFRSRLSWQTHKLFRPDIGHSPNSVAHSPLKA